MKGPSVRKDLYQDRLGSLPNKSTDVQHAAHSPAALVNTQKAVSQMLVTFSAAPKPCSKEKAT